MLVQPEAPCAAEDPVGHLVGICLKTTCVCMCSFDKICTILLQDELMPRYAELVYNGFWFSPERRALQAAIDETQKFCTGTVRVKLYKVATLLDCP